MRKRALLMFGVFLPLVALLSISVAAPPYDRTLTWPQSRTTTTGAAIPAGDSLITHIYVCDSETDNTTCSEIGVTASNVTVWSGTSTQPTNSTKYYRTRVVWVQQGSMSAYSPPSASFFLQGQSPTPAGAPAVQ